MTSSTGWAADDRPDGVAAGADRGTRRGQRRLEDPMGVRSGEVRSGNDVLIVGAGPTGLLLAGDLATAGVAVTVLERRTAETPGAAPTRAHASCFGVMRRGRGR